MSNFDELKKKKMFVRWNKISNELTKLVLEVDKENARQILEEIGFMLLSYPSMEKFMLEYEIYLHTKEKLKKSVDKKPKKRENNVVSIFDFKKDD
jgi:tRNA nucleotidyltransferase/poly(A) polymerase